MMNNFRYTDEKCPVCGETFTESSEIVVCPLCGTPHHKECYKKNGECGNSEKHNEGFIWKPENNPEEPQANENPYANADPYANPNPYANANANGQMPPYGAPVQPQIVYQLPNLLNAFPPEIDYGVSTQDGAAFIKSRVATYLQKFFKLKSGKRTFNIAAFFFGGYWFFYRKMYKLGAIFIALTMSLSLFPLLIPQYARMQNELDRVYTEYKTAVNTSNGSVEELTEALNNIRSEAIGAVTGNPVGAAVGALFYAANIALSVYLGLTADKKYMQHVVNRIRTISDAGETFGNNEFRRLRIISEGGTTFGYTMLTILGTSFISGALNGLLTSLIGRL